MDQSCAKSCMNFNVKEKNCFSAISHDRNGGKKGRKEKVLVNLRKKKEKRFKAKLWERRGLSLGFDR